MSAKPITEAFAAVVGSGGILSVIGRGTPLPCESATARSCGFGPLNGLLEVAIPPDPLGVAVSRDAVLVTHPRQGVVSRVDLAKGVLGWAAVGVEPTGIALSDDGTEAFVTDPVLRQVLSLDARTLQTLAAVELPARPGSIISDRGSVWMTLPGVRQIAQLADDHVKSYAVEGVPENIEADPGGRIWFTTSEPPRIAWLDPATGRVTVEHRATTSADLAVGAGGTVWVADPEAGVVTALRSNQAGKPLDADAADIEVFGDVLLVRTRPAAGVIEEIVVVLDGVEVGRLRIPPAVGEMAVAASGRQLVNTVLLPGETDWALGPCALAAVTGQRVLCPGPDVDVIGPATAVGRVDLGASGQGYRVSYDGEGIPPSANHPSVLVEAHRGRWTPGLVQERFPGRDVDTVRLRGSTTVRHVVSHDRGGGYHADHTVLLWEEAGWSYAVSIHGASRAVLRDAGKVVRSLVPWPARKPGTDLGRPGICRAKPPRGLGMRFAVSSVGPDHTVDVAGGGFTLAGHRATVRIVWEPGQERTIPPGNPLPPRVRTPTEQLLAETSGPAFCRRVRLPEVASGTYLLGVDLVGTAPSYAVPVEIR